MKTLVTGIDDIFLGKSNETCSRSNLIFRGLTQIFQLISLVKRKVNPTIEQQTYKGIDIIDRLLVLKMDFNFQISQRNKKNAFSTQFSQMGLFLSSVL